MDSQASKILSHCPLCKKEYKDADVQSLGEQNGVEMYHCTCHSCHHAMVAIILEQAGLLSSIGMVTDMEIHDALRFYKASSIQKDECILAHRVFEEESQAFCQVLLTEKEGKIGK